jgi:hypothetical protein
MIQQLEGSLKRLATDYIERLSRAWLRRYHSGGWDPQHPKQVCAGWKDTLYRLLELFRLALNEVPQHQRAIWLGQVYRTSGVLLADRTRL